MYLLTECSTVLLEKLTGFQLVEKFPAFYRSRRFITAFTSARHLSLYRGFLQMIRNRIRFYGDELLAPSPNPQVGGPTLSAVRDCLFNIFAATLHIGGRYLHPQPEDAPCCGDRDPLTTHGYKLIYSSSSSIGTTTLS
jgi:hypothetical protein